MAHRPFLTEMILRELFLEVLISDGSDRIEQPRVNEDTPCHNGSGGAAEVSQLPVREYSCSEHR